MKRAGGGYTLVEVLMVLAVSTLIFIAGILAFRGQQGTTEFNQAMSDLESKIQSYVSQVNAQAFSETQEYRCEVNASGPYLSTSAATNNQGCIFMGRAIQMIPGQSKLYAYLIFGARTNPPQMLGGDPVSRFDDTIVQVAIDNSAAGNIIQNLVDEYQIPGGATVKSSTIAERPSSDKHDLIGIYTSLEDDASEATAAGSTALLTKAYRADFSPPVYASNPTGPIKACINKTSPVCSIPITTKKWNLCMQSGDAGGRTAMLSLNSLPSGVTTQLKFEDC